MLLYFLGSSVTYGSATGGHSFVEEIAQNTDWVCVKEAVSGTTLAEREQDGGSSYVARLKKFDTDKTVSKLVVQLSTNDAAFHLPLGDVSEGEQYDQKTIIGAVEAIVAYAKQTWNCGILFYTNPYFGNVFYEEMVAALYRVQKKWGFSVVDFYNMRDMKPIDEKTLASYMSDAIHPNEKGYRWMSKVLIERLK